MDLENLHASGFIRAVDKHMAVKPARTQQRRIQDFRPVGRGHKDDARLRIKSVHFDQQLVQGLLAFVVSADRPDAAGFSESVQLIDEDDAGRLLFGLGKQISDARGAESHKHFYEFRSGKTEKGDAAFPGNSLGEHRFP